jgi:membrane carboxypeptidase/penicillin-binding protein
MEVLRRVVQSATARFFHDLDTKVGQHPSVSKTGTADDYADAWYVGQTPKLSTTVWVGYLEGCEFMIGVHDIEKPTGLTLALDIWSLYIAEATAEELVLGFRAPAGVSSSP